MSTLDGVVPPTDPNVSLTIPEFCVVERYSIAQYYLMRKRGHGPVEHCPPGMKSPRISPDARRAWQMRHQGRLEDNPVRVALRAKAVRAGKTSMASAKRTQ